MNWLRRVCLLVVLVFIAISPLFAATEENQAPRDIRGKTQRPGGALREAQGKQAPPLQSETEPQDQLAIARERWRVRLPVRALWRSTLRRTSRRRLRALCTWDFELPTLHARISAISLCS